jgi:hypothetical protein
MDPNAIDRAVRNTPPLSASIAATRPIRCATFITAALENSAQLKDVLFFATY